MEKLQPKTERKPHQCQIDEHHQIEYGLRKEIRLLIESLLESLHGFHHHRQQLIDIPLFPFHLHHHHAPVRLLELVAFLVAAPLPPVVRTTTQVRLSVPSQRYRCTQVLVHRPSSDPHSNCHRKDQSSSFLHYVRRWSLNGQTCRDQRLIVLDQSSVDRC